MACGVSLEVILEIIGHDGSAIVWADLPEPKRRRSFHVQECIWAAVKLGFAVTPFEVSPQLAATPNHIVAVIPPWTEEELLRSRGVMTGVARGGRHAVAYENGMIYDPNGTTIDFQNHRFSIETVWKIDMIS